MFKKTFFARILPIFVILLSYFNTPCNIALSAPYSNDEAASISVYEKIIPCTVAIDADLEQGISSGTGCVIDSSGIILTSSHVVNQSKNIEVTTQSGKTYKASVLAVLKDKNDLALLKITPKEKLPVIKLGDSQSVKVGQKVLAIGNPFGFRGTLTTGIISRIDYQRKKIQTDAAINPGCSGGPLLNLDGEVIGINQSIYNPDNNRSNIGIGFAVPVNYAKDFITIAKNSKKY